MELTDDGILKNILTGIFLLTVTFIYPVSVSKTIKTLLFQLYSEALISMRWSVSHDCILAGFILAIIIYYVL